MNTVTRSTAVVAIVAAVLAGLALLVPAAHTPSGGHGAPALVSVADGGTPSPSDGASNDSSGEDWG